MRRTTPPRHLSRRRPVLHGDVWARPVAVAEGYGPFRDFSCGQTESDRKVSQMITRRFAGEGPPALWIVMETGVDTLIGACGYFGRPLTYDVLPTPQPSVLNTTITIPNAAYVHVIAIKEEFRGMILPDGTRLGSYLLNHAQARIRRGWGGMMPWTWAYVDPGNRPSHALFTKHGFGWIPPQTEGEDWKRVWSPTARLAELSGGTPPWERHPQLPA